jgi:hypothetical protein
MILAHSFIVMAARRRLMVLFEVYNLDLNEPKGVQA